MRRGPGCDASLRLQRFVCGVAEDCDMTGCLKWGGTFIRASNFSNPASPRRNRKFGCTARFTIRALRYLDAGFSDIDVLHYGDVDTDAGHTAGEMLAGDQVVAVELVERTLESGNNILLHPAVLDGIAKVLSAHPMH